MTTNTLERTEGRYERQEVKFGKVYRWCPEHVKIECECGERLLLTATSSTTCPRCGADHTAIFREELNVGRSRTDGTLHPWRYEAQGLFETGLPC